MASQGLVRVFQGKLYAGGTLGKGLVPNILKYLGFGIRTRSRDRRDLGIVPSIRNTEYLSEYLLGTQLISRILGSPPFPCFFVGWVLEKQPTERALGPPNALLEGRSVLN